MNLPVSVIIINWNGWNDTIECLESLYQIDYSNYDVILVDNASSDDSIKKIKEYCKGELKVESSFFEYNLENKPISILEFTKVELETTKIVPEFSSLPSNRKLILIKNDENEGFAEGNNLGIEYILKHLNSEYILLLNNDTVVDKHFLGELTKVAESEDKIGVVGPNVYYYDRPNMITYIGGKINYYTGQITHPYLNKLEDGRISKEKLDYISGCGLLIKRKVVEEIGFLDSMYFLYYEDTDWCLRAKKKGYIVLNAPESKIWHKVSASTGQNYLNALYYGIRNHFLLIKKNCDLKHMLTFIPIFIMRKIIFSFLLLIKGKKKEFMIIMYAISDSFRGIYGFKDSN